MSTDHDERPAPRPRAAADSGSDPADLTPSSPSLYQPPTIEPPKAPATTTAALTAPHVEPIAPLSWETLRADSGAEATQQLGQRISTTHWSLLDDVHRFTAISKRALIEFALDNTYGTQEGKKLWQGK